MQCGGLTSSSVGRRGRWVGSSPAEQTGLVSGQLRRARVLLEAAGPDHCSQEPGCPGWWGPGHQCPKGQVPGTGTEHWLRPTAFVGGGGADERRLRLWGVPRVASWGWVVTVGPPCCHPWGRRRAFITQPVPRACGLLTRNLQRPPGSSHHPGDRASTGTSTRTSVWDGLPQSAPGRPL